MIHGSRQHSAQQRSSQETQDHLPDASDALDVPSLVREHSAAVYRYAYRLSGCSAEAEDLTQQAFLIAHQKLAQLREAARVRGWLLAVVRSCFLKSIRRPRPAAAQDVAVDLSQLPEVTAPELPIDRHELETALGQLDDEFRLVLLMFYFEELSYHQIAEQLDVPIGTIMSRLSRAKSHLRKKLAPLHPETASPKSPAAPRVFLPALALHAVSDLRP